MKKTQQYEIRTEFEEFQIIEILNRNGIKIMEFVSIENLVRQPNGKMTSFAFDIRMIVPEVTNVN